MSGPQPTAAVLCPSGRCRPQALLLGIVDRDGTVRYLGRPAPLDDDFVARAHQGRDPGMRFRFAEECATATCQHWSDTRCGLIDDLTQAAAVPDEADPGPLPRCGIRRSCRWWGQHGSEACHVCPRVVRVTPSLQGGSS